MLLLIALLAALLPFAAAPAEAAPGVPEDPALTYEVNFDQATTLPAPVGSLGPFEISPFWADVDACNGILISLNAVDGTDYGGCQAVQMTAIGELAALLGNGDPDNVAASSYTGPSQFPFATQQLESPPFAITTNRFYVASVDVAAFNCNRDDPRHQFYIEDAAGTQTILGPALSVCQEGTPTTDFVGCCGPTRVGTIVSPDAIAWSGGATAAVGVLNTQSGGSGNDSAIDNMRLLDATPSMDKSFSPDLLGANSVSTLTFTITNTSELAAKPNMSFTDTLPANLVVVGNGSPGGTCPATVSASGSLIDVTGVSLGDTITSCTVTVEVTALIGGTYVNGADNMTTSFVKPPPDTSVTFTEAPEVRLTKVIASTSPDPLVGAGGTITYDLVVENVGNLVLYNVGVTDPKLASVDCSADAAILATMAPGDIATCTGTYTLSQADVDTGFVDNSAVALGTDHHGTNIDDISDAGLESVETADGSGVIDGDPTNDPTTIPVTPAPQLTLVKTITSTSPDPLIAAGGTINYLFEVTNTGNLTVDNVSITDPKLSVDCSDPANAAVLVSMAPGDSAACTGTYVTTQADIDAGFVDNTATADGLSPAGVAVTDVSDAGDEVVETADGSGVTDGDPTNDPTTTRVGLPPELTLVKTITSTSPDPLTGVGDVINYSLVVTNTGTITVLNVGVTDPKLTVDCSAGAAQLASMAPADTVTCTGSYALTQADVDAGFVDNTAVADGLSPAGVAVTDVSDAGDETVETADGEGNTDGDTTNDPTTIPVSPDPELTVTKTITSTSPDPLGGVGDLINYSIVVENTGNVTIADVAVTDPKLTVDCTVDAAALASLAPGDTATCTGSYALTQADLDAGFVDNSATATGEDPDRNDVTDISDAGDETVETPDGSGNTDNDTTNDPTTIPVMPDPELTLVKTIASTSPDPLNGVGDTITYNLVVSNTGTATITNVVVTDPKLAVDCSNPADALILASMAPGDTATCVGTYTLTQADVDTGYVDNTATATGQDPDGNNVSDISDAGDETVETPDGEGNTDNDTTNDPTTIPVTPAPQLTLVKTITGASPEPLQHAGGTISYQFEVTNTGNVTITNVAVTDPKLTVDCSNPTDAAVLASMAPGDSAKCTGTYVTSQSDVNAGYVDNSALATGQDPDDNNVTDVSDAGDEGDETADSNGVTDGDPTNDPTVFPVVPNPDITLTKTVASTSPDPLVGAGGTITFNFVIENTGNVTVTDVDVTDPKLDNVDCSTDAAALASMDPGNTATCSGTYTVTQADVDAAIVENTATAEGTDPSNNAVTDISDAGDEVVETPDANGNTDGDPTNDPTLTPITPAPELTLVKTVTSTSPDPLAGVGDLINYSFAVENTGNVTVTGVAVTDPKLTVDCTVDAAALASMAPGDTATCTGSYAITQADIDANIVENSALTTGQDPAGNSVSDVSDAGDETIETPDGEGNTDNDPTNDPTLTPIGLVPELTVTKTITSTSPDPLTGVGDQINYAIVVENTGNLTLTDVVVTDPKLTVDCSNPADAAVLASMAPGETATCVGTYTLTQADVDTGYVDNTATASGQDPADNNVSDISDAGDETVETPDGEGNTDNDTTNDPTTIPVTPAPQLTVVKTITSTSPDPLTGVGDQIDYSIEVTNTGNVTITNVAVTDPKISVDCSNPADATTLVSMAPGDTATCIGSYTLTLADIDTGYVDNTATATGQDPDNNNVTDVSDAGDETVETPDGEGNTDGDTTNDPTTIPITPAPQLTVVKTITSTSPDPLTGVGDLIDYSIVVTNTGNVTITNVAVTDPKLTVDCSADATQLASMDPGDAAACTGSYTLTQADVDTGYVDNTATATGQDPAGNNVSDVSDAGDETVETADGEGNTDGDTTNDPTTIPVSPDPELTVTKTITSTSPDPLAGVGDLINYSFAVENTGNVTVTGVAVTDPKLTVDCTVDAAALASMAPGDTATCTGSYALTQADLDDGFVDNSATATGQDPDGDDVTDISDAGDETIETPDGEGNTDNDTTNDPTTIPVTPAPQLTVTKTITSTSPDPLSGVGDLIDYSIVVTNTGNVTITDVVVTDPKLAVDCSNPADAAVLASMAPGDTATCVGTYTLTQADVDTGYVDNTATATGQDPDGNNVSDISDAGDETIETPDGEGNTDNDTTNDPTTIPVTPAPQLTLVKTITGASPEPLQHAGGTISYQFEVTNTGNVTITNVAVTDPKLTVDCSNPTDAAVLASMAPGDSAKCTGTYVTSQSDVNAGYVDNSALATGQDPDDNNVTDVSDAGDEGDETADSNGVTDGDPTNDPTVFPVVPNPDITLTKTVASTSPDPLVGAGGTITFNFVIENTGNVTVTDVDVTDPKLDNVDCSTDAAALASMDPGNTATCSGTYTVTQADVDAAIVENTATAEGTDPSNNAVTDISDAGDEVVETPDANGNTDGDPTNDPTLTPITPAPELTLVKTVTSTSPDPLAGVGDLINYSFAVENTGNVTVTGVAVTDPKLTVDCTVDAAALASMAPGDTATCTGSYALTQADLDAGFVDNSATATGQDPDGDDVTDISDAGDETVETPDGEGNTDNDTTNDPTTIPVTPAPQLTVTKTITSTSPDPLSGVGDLIDYSIVVTNTGNVTITNVVVTDPKLTVDCSDPANATALASMAPGDTATCVGTYTLTQADVDTGYVDNTATATGQDPDGNNVSDISDAGDETIETPDGEGNTDNDTTNDPTTIPVTPAPQLTLVKTITGASPEPLQHAGGTISYQFEVTNTGNVTITNVAVTDPKLTVDCSNPTDAAVLASMAPGDSAKCTGTYVTSQSDVNAGYVDNSALATGQDPDDNNVTDVSDAGDEGDETADSNGVTDGDPTNDPTVFPVVPNPDITLTKTVASTSPDPLVGAGGTITFNFVIENTGNVTVTDVDVTDPKLDNVDCSTDAAALASMDPGNTATCSGTYTVTQADVDAAIVENTATAEGTDPSNNAVTDISDAGDEVVETPDANGNTDGDPTNDPTLTPITPAPELTLVKTVTSTSPDPLAGVGDLINYSFAVENTGNVTVTGVAVTDPKLTVDCTVDAAALASMAPGDTATCTGSYALTQADLDAGFVDNSATATGQDPDGDDVTDISDAGDETVETPDGEGNTDNDTTNDPTTIPVTPAPQLTVTKTITSTSPDPLSGVGDLIDYSIVVTNTGNVTITNVVVTDPKLAVDCSDPANATALASMAPGDTATCVGTYTLTQADVDTGYVDNTATATGQDPDGNNVTDISDAGDETVETPDGEGNTDNDTTNDPTTIPVTPAPQLTLVKTITGASPEPLQHAGGTISYQFEVTNTGNVTITNVAVTDPKLTVDCSNPTDAAVLASMAPGDSAKCTGTYVTSQSDVNAGYVDNSALATGQDPDDNNVTDVSDAGDEGDETADSNGVTDGDPTNDPTVFPVVPNPDITLTKTVASTSPDPLVGAGGTITFNFVIENTGNVTVTDVDVTDPKLDNVDCSTDAAALASMDPGNTATCSGTYTVTQADVDAAIVENTATAEGTDPSNNAVTDISDAGDEVVETPDANGNTDGDPTNDPTLTPITPAPELTLVKTVTSTSPDPLAGVGDLINYSFAVENTGNVTVTGVAVTDPKLTVDCTVDAAALASMAPGDTATCTGSYALTQADLDAGFVDNSATATGQDPDGDDVTDISDAGDETVETPDGEGNTDNDTTNDPTTIPVTPAPQLTVTKTITSTSPDPLSGVGDLIDYSIVVTNTGNVTITNVVVTDPKLAVDCSDPANATALASMAPGDTATCVGTYTLTQADVDTGYVDNTATATGQDPDGNNVTDISDAGDETVETPDGEGNTDNDTTNDPTTIPVTPAPQLTLVKTITGASPEPLQHAGGTISYQFEVTNTGNVTITNVAVTDPKLTVDCSNPTDAAVLASMAPGDSAKCTGTYVTSQSDVNAGYVDNTALATGQDPDDNNVTDVSDAGDETVETPDGEGNIDGDTTNDPTTVTVAPDPEVKLLKFISGSSAPDVAVGVVVDFLFHVTNTGNVTITDMVVTDPKLDTVDCSADATQLASMDPGDTATCVGTYTLTQADADNGYFENSATTTGQDPDGNDVTDVSDAGDETGETPDGEGNTDGDPTNDPTVFPFDAEPLLTLTKTVASTSPDPLIGPGGTITFEFTVLNSGNVTIRDAVVTDPKLGGLVCDSTTTPALELLLPTQTATCTGTYTVTAADVSASGVENTATVTGQDPDGDDVTDISDAGDETVETPNLDGNTDGDPTNDPTVVTVFPEAAPDQDLDNDSGSAVTVNPLLNDADGVELDPASVRLVDPITGELVTSLTVAGEGTWTVNAETGEVTFDPQNGYTGNPTPVHYEVMPASCSQEPDCESVSSTITITYKAPTPTPRPPTVLVLPGLDPAPNVTRQQQPTPPSTPDTPLAYTGANSRNLVLYALLSIGTGLGLVSVSGRRRRG